MCKIERNPLGGIDAGVTLSWPEAYISRVSEGFRVANQRTLSRPVSSFRYDVPTTSVPWNR
jgi:hypothetical protein